VVELVETRAAIASALASAPALDALAPAGTYRCRIAPDELLLVREPGAAESLVRDAGAARAGDPDAVVVDVTDGWAVWTLDGDGARDAFRRLSTLDPAEGFVQGEVAAVPAKVVVEHGAFHLFVPAMWSEHLRTEILARCEGVVALDEPVDWTAVGGSA
jgi:sarcosine oxidase gamma subunit